jgi:hypothetical protein
MLGKTLGEVREFSTGSIKTFNNPHFLDSFPLVFNGFSPEKSHFSTAPFREI